MWTQRQPHILYDGNRPRVSAKSGTEHTIRLSRMSGRRDTGIQQAPDHVVQRYVTPNVRNPTYSKDSRGNTNDIWQITPPTRYSIMPKLKPAVLTGPPVSMLTFGREIATPYFVTANIRMDVLRCRIYFFFGSTLCKTAKHFQYRISPCNAIL